jgi:uncharacterized phage-associated protein
MPCRIYTANQIGSYFLAKTDEDVGDLISNLKLQKLCYYAQGVGLAVRGEPMFREPIEAWLHGPVVPALYREFRDYGSNAIPPVRNLNMADYTDADRMVLDDVFDYYGQYSAWRLREMTHTEAPWKCAYEAGPNTLITLDALQDYFSNEIKPDYVQRYEQIQRGETQAR